MNIYVRRINVLSGLYRDNDRGRPPQGNELIIPGCATVTEPNLQARTLPSAATGALERAPKTSPQAAPQTEIEMIRDADPSQILRAPATLPGRQDLRDWRIFTGRADLLRIMLARVDADRRQRPVARPILLFMGDYVDRGPSSREVLDILLEYRSTSESIFLKGKPRNLHLRAFSKIRRFCTSGVFMEASRRCYPTA